MKWIRRVLAAVLIVLVLLVVGAGAFAFYDSQLGEQAADVTNTGFITLDNTEIGAYLAVPEDASEDDGPFPAVLMVHEWWGLNAEITDLADMLAEQGYVVLAPDTYRGKVATTVPGALALRLTTSEERVNSDMMAAYEYLTSLENVDAERVGVIGFCYGGGVALRLATINPALAAMVNLYGDTITDPENFGALAASGAPLLGIFGGVDQQIPVSEVQAFDAALDAADIPNTVTIYDDVGHAFVNPSSIEAGGSAAEAWTQILTFFEETLKGA